MMFIYDSNHLLTCRDPRARKSLEVEVKYLIDKLQPANTEPYIGHALKFRVMRWLKEPKDKFRYDDVPKATIISLQAQYILDWNPFI